MTVVREFFALLGLDVDERSFDRGEKAMENVKKVLTGLVVGAGAVAGAIALATNEFVKQAKQLDDWAAITGESVERLDAMRIAIQQLGGEANTVFTGMGNLANRLNDLFQADKPGDTPTGKALQKLKIDMRSLRDEPLVDTFDRVITAMQGIEDPAKRAAIATDLFGNAAGRMIAGLDPDELRAYRDEALALGLVMSEQDVKAAKAFNAAVIGLRTTLISLAGAGIAQLLPQLSKLARGIGAVLLRQREFIASKFGTVAAVFAKALTFLVTKSRDYIDVVRDMTESVGGLTTILKVLAIVAGVYLAGQVGTVLVSAFTAAIAAIRGFNLMLFLMKALLYAEVVAIGLLAAVIVLAIDEMITAIQGGETVIDDFLNSKKIDPDDNVIIKAIRAIILQIALATKLWSSLITAFSEGFTSDIGKAALQDAADALKFAGTGASLLDQKTVARFLEGKPFLQPTDVDTIGPRPLAIPPPPSRELPLISVPSRGGGNTTVSATANIEINAPGGDAAAIRDAVGPVVEQKMREAVVEAARKKQGG